MKHATSFYEIYCILHNKNMKLIYIVNARIPTEKAHGYQICKMCEEFSAAGAEVELWVSTRKNTIKENAFAYYGVKENFKIRYLKCFDFIKYDKFFLHRAMYLQSIWFFLKLMFLRMDQGAIIYTRNPELAWLYSKKYFTVFDAHSWPESKIGLYKYFLQKAGAIICNSRGTEKKYQENGFTKTLAIPNGVDLNDFQNNNDMMDLRKKLSLPMNKKIAMYIGHLYKWKGVDTIVSAAELLQEKKDLIFIIIGGTEKDVKKYCDLIQNKKLDNIIFYGHRHKPEIPEFLQAADILLLPNAAITAEAVDYTSPIKMFEYMASGRPIIASSLPSIREILDDSTAFFCQPGDAKDLADKIEFVLANQALAQSKAGLAHEKALEFGWDKRAKKILEKIKCFA